MTVQTTADTDMAIVGAGFDAFAKGDLGGFAEMFHPDGTWNHRNPDRLGGVHHGRDAIVAFLGESMRLTDGTLRPVPQSVMADGAGHVVMLVRITGTRPDGRTFDDRQVLVVTVEGARVRSIDQYVGDPPGVTAFWA